MKKEDEIRELREIADFLTEGIDIRCSNKMGRTLWRIANRIENDNISAIKKQNPKEIVQETGG